MKSLPVSYATSKTLVKGDSPKDRLNLLTVVPDHRRTQPPKLECPQKSPLLRKYTSGVERGYDYSVHVIWIYMGLGDLLEACVVYPSGARLRHRNTLGLTKHVHESM